MADGAAPRGVRNDAIYALTARDRLVARASVIVSIAIKRGLLPELETLKCEDCGAQAECYDHRNYHKPLSVDAVCKGCNNRRGPGLPLPTAADGQVHKLQLPEGMKSTGKCWSNIEGGDGFVLQELRVHGDLDWKELETSNDDAADRSMNVGMQRVNASRKAQRGGIRTARYEYFKARDPWSLAS